MTNRRNTLARLAGLALLLAALVARAAPAPGMYWPPITDPPTGTYTPGKWIWAELLTRDVGRAAQFYGQVFGWTFETYGPKDDAKTYTQVSSNGTPIAGMVFLDPRDRSLKPDARWVGIASVGDPQLVAGRVINAGGKVLMAPRKLGTRGDAAVFADPEGGVFGVLHSATGDPEDYVADENSWLWAELWADDAPAMAKFYATVGGYDVAAGASTGTDQGFHLDSGGYARAGVLRKPLPNTPTAWILYVRVKDVAATVAKAQAAGGRVVIEPMQARGTRVALLIDPTGAPFAVAEWNRN
ncbi:MAG TPA: VOC family protein [Steroidobacteraceae bacterium]